MRKKLLTFRQFLKRENSNMSIKVFCSIFMRTVKVQHRTSITESVSVHAKPMK